jgi:hypothetical protein
MYVRKVSGRACISSNEPEMYWRKNEPQHDVLVLRGVRAAAQGIRHTPQLGFVAEGGGQWNPVRLSYVMRNRLPRRP